MRIALVSGEFPPMQGGVGDYTRAMAREFARRGCIVRVIGPRGVAAQPGEPYALTGERLSRWISLPAIDRATRACDAVHIQYQAAAYGMSLPIHFAPRFLRARAPGRKVLVTFHDLKVPYLFPKAAALRWQAVRMLARAAHAVVVTNQEDEQSLAAGWPEGTPLRLIPIGSNIDASVPGADRAATRAALGVPDDDIMLCYFGFLNASKGGETLARAFAALLRRGHPVRLLMLGGETGASDPTNQAYARKVRALLEELGVAARVIWAGYRQPLEVSALWRASDIAVLPYADGVSLRRGTLMAALAHGMPIVSTWPRVPVAQLRDGENIALAAAGDGDALAARVSDLVASAPLRAQLARGAAVLAQEFTWPRIVDRHLELYHALGVAV